MFHQCFCNGFKISNAYRKDCVEKTQASADWGCEPYNNLIPALGTLHFSTNFNSFFPNLPGEQNQKILASFPLSQSRSYSKLKYPFIALTLLRVSFPWEAQSKSLAVKSQALFLRWDSILRDFKVLESTLWTLLQIQKATSF